MHSKKQKDGDIVIPRGSGDEYAQPSDPASAWMRSRYCRLSHLTNKDTVPRQVTPQTGDVPGK